MSLASNLPARSPGVRVWWRSVVWLLVTALLLFGVLLGGGWLVTHVEPGTPLEQLDLGILRWLAAHRVPVLDTASAYAERHRLRSTRSANCSATAHALPRAAPPTSGRRRSCRWASPGTTCTSGSDLRPPRHRPRPDPPGSIWAFEKPGWAHSVRWPTTARKARLVAG